MANLRILYNNIADFASITASSYVGTLLPINLRSDKKSKVWRSAPGTTATLTVTLTSDKPINCVILPFNNLSSTATIKLTIKDILGNIIFTRGPELATRGKVDPSGSTVNAYAYAQGNYSVFWLGSIVVGSTVIIEFSDPNNAYGYIECSRIVMGEYWSPKYNTGFGMTMTQVDSSTANRSDSGDYLPIKGPKHRQLSFDLAWMDANDRDKINDIANNNGSVLPLFVSLFPEDGDPLKEQVYQIYGFLMQEPALAHAMHTMYSTRLEVTEY